MEKTNYTRKSKDGDVSLNGLAKTLFSNDDVLAQLVKDVIPEFFRFSRDEIAQAIRDKAEPPLEHNIEKNPPYVEDVEHGLLFRIPVPHQDKNVNVLLNMGVQTDMNPPDRLHDRAVRDARALLADENAISSVKNNIMDMEATYSIRLDFGPNKELSGVMDQVAIVLFHRTSDGKAPFDDPSLINRRLLYTERWDNLSFCEITEMIRTILFGGDSQHIKTEIKDRFNVEVDDDFIEEVNRMGQISDGFYNLGLRMGKQEERARFVSILTKTVIKSLSLDKSLEEPLKFASVPEDCIEDVKAAVHEHMKRVLS